jgi:hypothetical protein
MRLQHAEQKAPRSTGNASYIFSSSIKFEIERLAPDAIRCVAGAAAARQKKLEIRACKFIMLYWVLRIDARTDGFVREIKVMNADWNIEFVGAQRCVSNSSR